MITGTCKFLIDQGCEAPIEVEGSAFRIKIGNRMVLFVVHKAENGGPWYMVSHHASGLRVGPGFHKTSLFLAEEFARSYLKGQFRAYSAETILAGISKAPVLNPKLKRKH